MSAEILRRAAALMRERAEAARAGRWLADGDEILADWLDPRSVAACEGSLPEGNKLNAEHIASWHPAVALAVADWLDAIAAPFDSMWEADEDGVLWGCDFDGDPLRLEDSTDSLALAVARAYLGEQS